FDDVAAAVERDGKPQAAAGVDHGHPRRVGRPAAETRLIQRRDTDAADLMHVLELFKVRPRPAPPTTRFAFHTLGHVSLQSVNGCERRLYRALAALRNGPIGSSLPRHDVQRLHPYEFARTVARVLARHGALPFPPIARV